MDDEVSLHDYLDVLRRRWLVIALCIVAATAFMFVRSIRQKPVYEANTTILVRFGGETAISKFGLLGPAGGQSSKTGGSGDLTELLRTRAVASKVLKDLNLRERIQGWDNPKLKEHKLASRLKGVLQQPMISGNLVELTVEYPDPELAAEIANGFVNALSYYWNRLNYTEAQKKRKYIESQLPRVKKDLRLAEKKIKSFSLLGIRKPSVEFGRLEREFEIQNAVYIMLRKEFETVKLEESKEIPPFSLVDDAKIPDTSVRPKVKFDTQVGFIAGIFLGVFVAFFQEFYDKSKRK